MSSRIEELCNRLDNERNRIWLKEPEDIEQLRKGKTRGSFGQSLTPVFYADSISRELISYLWTLRGLGDADIPIPMLCKIAASVIASSVRSFKLYGLDRTSRLLSDSSSGFENVKSKSDYLKLLDSLLLYLGKVNFWIDTVIPWQDLGETFEKTVLRK